MMKIHPKMKALECSHRFSHYQSMGIFSRRSKAANSAVPGWILLNFESVRDFMGVLVTCKSEEDPIQIGEIECSQDVSPL